MLANKNIVIISPNQLQGIGLKTILEEYFSPKSISIMGEFTNNIRSNNADYIFMPSDMYIARHAQLQAIKSRIIILTIYDTEDKLQETLDVLNVTNSQSDLVDRLKIIFQKNSKSNNSSYQEELTFREIDVLKLVACGFINKQIADKLSISLHTVISHRKNITRKLGIKTVAGLTVYALLNGLITSRDIE